MDSVAQLQKVLLVLDSVKPEFQDTWQIVQLIADPTWIVMPQVNAASIAVDLSACKFNFPRIHSNIVRFLKLQFPQSTLINSTKKSSVHFWQNVLNFQEMEELNLATMNADLTMSAVVFVVVVQLDVLVSVFTHRKLLVSYF